MNRYNSYKNSNIEWVGKIPSHWIRTKTNFISRNLDGKRVPLNGSEREDMKGKIPYWGSNGVVDYINQSLFEEELVLVGEDGSPFFDKLKDVSFYINEPVWINNHIHVLKADINVLAKYLVYSFNCIDYKHFITGSTRDKLTKSDLSRIPHILPPINEQQQIVNFLDYKTKKIDQLLAYKKKKIELLKEKRIALISHVVTKGLNPYVEMKDSGVEWIGKIPKHWEFNQIKRAVELLTDYDANGSFSTIKNNVNRVESNEDRYSWLVRATDLEQKTELKLTNDYLVWVDKKTHSFLAKSFLNGEEILVAKRGEIGKIYQMPLVNFPATLGPNMYLVRLNNNKLYPSFVYYYFSIPIGKNQLKIRNKSTTIGALYKDDFKDILILYPSIEEQKNIVNHIEEQCNEIEDLINLEQQKIDLLKEYRQSLISEVVTGKTRVCDE